jgi:hypothetical protein
MNRELTEMIRSRWKNQVVSLLKFGEEQYSFICFSFLFLSFNFVSRYESSFLCNFHYISRSLGVLPYVTHHFLVSLARTRTKSCELVRLYFRSTS